MDKGGLQGNFIIMLSLLVFTCICRYCFFGVRRWTRECVLLAFKCRYCVFLVCGGEVENIKGELYPQIELFLSKS